MEIRRIIHNFIYEQRWTLGFIEESVKQVVLGKSFNIKYVKGMPQDRWFADPFILDYDESFIKVLAEEFSYKLHRGRIALVVIDRNDYKFVKYKILLDINSHLSFPFIIREDKKVLVYPENSISGCWTQYEYDSFKEQLVNPKVVIKEPLTDAIMTKLFDKKQIFSTIIPTQNGSELSIYSDNGIKIQTITFSSNIARNAGDWFKIDGKIYRPAQDCNSGYGCAVILQEVTKDNDSYFFKDVRRIESDNKLYSTGCHTFNNYNNLIVIDVHGWRRPKVTKAYFTVLRLLNRMKFV